MPGKNYRSISVNDELIESVRQLIKNVGTYHSISEFAAEAIRLRVEALTKAQNEGRSEPDNDC